MIKLRNKYKEPNLLVKIKLYMTLYELFNSKKVKKIPKNLIFYIHSTLLVIYSTDNHKQLL